MRQRSKQLWLHSRDKNTKYFHTEASVRRRNNQISKLRTSEGSLVDWDNGLANHIEEFYSHLFTATNSNWQEVIEGIEEKITAKQNLELMQQVTEEEVKAVYFT